MRLRGIPLLLFLLALGAPASGQPDAGDSALAEALFQQGKDLMKKGRYDEACPKLAESHRLDPAGGTLLNLARCHELAGEFASAWARYYDAEVSARRDGVQSRTEVAEKKRAELELRLSQVVLSVPFPVEGLRVFVDDRIIQEAAWEVALPLDGGRHVVRAEAPGHEPWLLELSLEPEKDRREITIPQLVLITETAAPAPAPASPSEEPPPLPIPPVQELRTHEPVNEGPPSWAPWVGGASLALVGLGTFFGVRAIQLRADSDRACPNERCTRRGKRLNDDAIRFATAADITIGLGVLGAGVSLWFGLAAPGSAGAAQRVRIGGRF